MGVNIKFDHRTSNQQDMLDQDFLLSTGLITKYEVIH